MPFKPLLDKTGAAAQAAISISDFAETIAAHQSVHSMVTLVSAVGAFELRVIRLLLVSGELVYCRMWYDGGCLILQSLNP